MRRNGKQVVCYYPDKFTYKVSVSLCRFLFLSPTPTKTLKSPERVCSKTPTLHPTPQIRHT
jgi:hypothetical protein